MKKVITFSVSICILCFFTVFSFAEPDKKFKIEEYTDVKGYYESEYGQFNEYIVGYDQGHEEGYEEGYSQAEEELTPDGTYDEGWDDGYEQAKEEYSVPDEEEETENKESKWSIGSIVASVIVGGILVFFIGGKIYFYVKEAIQNKKEK